MDGRGEVPLILNQEGDKKGGDQGLSSNNKVPQEDKGKAGDDPSSFSKDAHSDDSEPLTSSQNPVSTNSYDIRRC